VTAANDTAREITLSYKDAKHNKVETFVVVIPKRFKLPLKKGGDAEVVPSMIPLGTRLIVYYEPRSRKVNGKKEKYYEMIKMNPAPPPGK
jgi:hypothetical protein